MSHRRNCLNVLRRPYSVVIRKDRNLWKATLYWNAEHTVHTVRVALYDDLFMSHEAALFGAQKMLERYERIES